ncbi:MAG: sugar transferase [Aminivibrio sp.]|jgi:lipopolysaccharide/colanic/teichoic acid biosynthesis glycosyltransferase
MKKIYPAIKRIFDFTAALAGLILLSPLLLVLAALVRCKLGSPVLFKQDRPGLNGKIFTMYKFRTMTDGRNKHGKLLPDEERLTKLGAFLRKSSMDELPELWNVLKGDMSLVGPRPLLTEYIDFYTEREMLRHTVRPGITGLAQISGRNNLPWDERLEIDVKYIETISFKGDITILFKTIMQVIHADNVVIIPGTRQKKLSDIRKKGVQNGK